MSDVAWGIALILGGLALAFSVTLGNDAAPALTLTSAVLSATTGGYLLIRYIDHTHRRADHDDIRDWLRDRRRKRDR